MDSRVIGKIIYFWVFMLGVVLVGKFMGVMEDGKMTIIICIAAAILYIVWNVFRSLGKKKREEREWEAEMAQRNAKKKKRK
ncbi:MAG: hypothetical protein MJ161_02565 [Clostridia bacterium]|nr:hypothetical protein [Clostridia bacterium]